MFFSQNRETGILNVSIFFLDLTSLVNDRIISLLIFSIWGKPDILFVEIFDGLIILLLFPFRSTFLNDIFPKPLFTSIQLTMTLPFFSISRSILPIGYAPSLFILIRFPKDSPLSFENFKFIDGSPFDKVNQAIATNSPLESIDGPLTGQP